jgi:hypothetical protein
MKIKRFFCIAMCVAAIAAAGCRHDDEGIIVKEDQLYGVWQKRGTEEFWSYRADGKGHTWDRADDIMGETDSGSVAYSWTVSGDRLRHRFVGTSIDSMVVRTYKITDIEGDRMVREEEIGTYTLMRVGE